MFARQLDDVLPQCDDKAVLLERAGSGGRRDDGSAARRRMAHDVDLSRIRHRPRLEPRDPGRPHPSDDGLGGQVDDGVVPVRQDSRLGRVETLSRGHGERRIEGTPAAF